MSDPIADLQARLADWRRDGADRIAPVRFAMLEALGRRAARTRGGVRALLEARLRARVGAYAAEMAAAARTADSAAHAPSGVRPLAALLRDLDGRSEAATAAPDVGAGPTARPDRIAEARRASTAARSESQLRQALEPAPGDAGPLNSARLVHRALLRMRERSPAYLQAFVAYVDSLASLEGMQANLGPSEPGPAPARRPRAPRSRARGRRG